jgi:hypothetical protein
MAQDLTVNIKTTSDVPQAMDKAKSATVSFSKQVEDIQKKFSTAFKDIFLGFTAPMVLLNGAISLVSKLIAENQRKQEEANKAAIDGTNELMSAEDRYWARKQDRERKDKENVEQAKQTREQITEEFLRSGDARAKKILEREQSKLGDYGAGGFGAVTAYGLARDPAVQKEVQKIIAEEAMKNPELGSALEKSAVPDKFKSPEGFSNVIGVGANPVMEAMTLQLEEQKKTNEILTQIATNNGGQTGSWLNAQPGSNQGGPNMGK